MEIPDQEQAECCEPCQLDVTPGDNPDQGGRDEGQDRRWYGEEEILQPADEKPEHCADAVEQPAKVLLDPVDKCNDDVSHGQFRQLHEIALHCVLEPRG